jgi:uncharacterized membrane protein
MSCPLGLLSGILAAVGYYALYTGLQQGPLALVSPIVAADSAVAAFLTLLFLQEQVDVWQDFLLIPNESR